MINLWKPAALAAYCNQGRNGSTLLDSGMLGRNATLTKSGTWSQVVNHKDRWAIDLDGEQYGSVPSVGFGYTANLTVTAWVCPSVYGTMLGVCGHRPGTGGFYVQLAGSQLQATTYAVGNTIRTVGTYSPNTWHHIAVRFTAASTTIFWDGAIVGTPSTFGLIPLSHASSPIRIWAIEGTTGVVIRPFLGMGADLCLWPGNLTDSEIKWLATPGNNVLNLPVASGFPLSRLVN